MWESISQIFTITAFTGAVFASGSAFARRPRIARLLVPAVGSSVLLFVILCADAFHLHLSKPGEAILRWAAGTFLTIYIATAISELRRK